MFLLDDRIVLSPSDLRLAAECEFALLRALDVRLGRVIETETKPDPMLERVAQLGDEHEQAELRRLRAAHPGPGAVVSFTRPPHTDEALREAHDLTVRTLADPSVEVLTQATVYDGSFVGHIDFLERTVRDDGTSAWIVSDTKLARSASVPALLQVAGYADTLARAGVPLAPVARLVLGSGVVEDFRLDEIVPVFRARRTRLETIATEHRMGGVPVQWGDDRFVACGRCPVCEDEVAEHDDLLLVAGMRRPTRRHLLDAGITTMTELATSTGAVEDLSPAQLDKLRAQARLQVAGRAAGGELTYEVIDQSVLARLPWPSPGDIYFDFEGDPIWVEPGDTTWGLEYLFGLIEVDGHTPTPDDPAAGTSFVTFWAHDRDQERTALIDFVDYVTRRRARWPDLHIYHYAPYETAALTRLAARHGVCEDEIDQFLREGVFVDLYATVRGAVRVSDRSYSLKKLEPLYMSARDAEVTNAADSIVVYHEFMAARDAGRTGEAERLLADIADYNRDDCVSTMLLAGWLRGLRDGTAVPAQAVAEPTGSVISDRRRAQLDLEAAVRALVARVKPGDRSPDDHAVALAAAAVLFHAREAKPFWQRYFDRLRHPAREWRGSRDEPVFVVDSGEVVTDWARTGRQLKPRRVLRLTGETLGGMALEPGAPGMRAVYATPAPDSVSLGPDACYGEGAGCAVVEATTDAVGSRWVKQTLIVEETCPGTDGHAEIPAALVFVDQIRTGSLEEALSEIAEEVRSRHPSMPTRAGIDVLRRVPPRLRSGGALPVPGAGDDRFIVAIRDALLGMDDSYVAVQGPPGTGKTFIGGRVIAALVRDHGWTVAVCSQSHQAIENILTAIIDAGVPAEQVAKDTRATQDPGWTDLAKADELRRFIDERSTQHPGAGFVVGGTAWDLTNTRRIQRGELDLVVIDEAGQYSLANTLAASVAGARLLLLGDPAQLPQVSSGTHPDPVDSSALGWLLPADVTEGRTLPATHGYFLERTWRLHPALVEPLSVLAYDGALLAQEGVGDARNLDGLAPGLHQVLVEHHDNSTASVEEAHMVVRIIEDLLGAPWHDPAEGPMARPLGQRDVIVITPYNHQVQVLTDTLAAAGLDEVAVGTVDKFQGQEAAVAILSMAASSHTDVSRGMGFLLSRNRLNVALSRGKWAAIIVRSPVLTDFAPRSTDELVALGAFLTLTENAHALRPGAVETRM
ncbi:MAG TPA: TM0106 family RecB-like putative nuclease [Intrasporangiaceae bacterium]|nr:TM0106 family RecB-like putative nuclease [Intrasporangiaceae bacterium]